MIKYSIIEPFYNRDKEFYNTLLSFRYHYGNRNDYEIIVLEDYKTNNESHEQLRLLLEQFKDLPIRYYHMINNYPMATMLNNTGVSIANGEYIMLTCPECMHKTNILAGLDTEFASNPNKYIMCACQLVNMNNKADKFEDISVAETGIWMQHSRSNNRILHFCSSISKQQFINLKGFDERYGVGQCYDDDDFRNKVLEQKIPVILRDDLLAYHISHDKEYQYTRENVRIEEVNRQYYMQKWRHFPEIRRFHKWPWR